MKPLLCSLVHIKKICGEVQEVGEHQFTINQCVARQLPSCYNDNERGMQKIDMDAILHLQESGSKVTRLSSRGKKLLTINARKRRPQRAVTSSKGIVKKSNPVSSAVVVGRRCRFMSLSGTNGKPGKLRLRSGRARRNMKESKID